MKWRAYLLYVLIAYQSRGGVVNSESEQEGADRVRLYSVRSVDQGKAGGRSKLKPGAGPGIFEGVGVTGFEKSGEHHRNSNMAELKNVVERAEIICKEDRIVILGWTCKCF